MIAGGKGVGAPGFPGCSLCVCSVTWVTSLAVTSQQNAPGVSPCPCALHQGIHRREVANIMTAKH